MKDTGARRTYFLGKIKVNFPLHIGLGNQIPEFTHHETDQPVLLDHESKPFIPATSLGGLMRSTAENLVSVLKDWDLQDLISLFGTARQEKEERQRSEETGKDSKSKLKFSVSKLRIRHAKLVGNWRGWTEIRDSVGIDRQRGVAKAAIKFDYEVVPPGLEFDLWLELRDGNERDKILLTLVLLALEKLPLSVGAKGGSGLGALQLILDKVVELDLHDRRQLLDFLLERDEFIRQKCEGRDWEDWKESVLQNCSFCVKADANYRRIPQVFVFTYRLTVEDPLLVANRRVDPMLAFEGFIARRSEDLRHREKRELDAVWIGFGNEMDMRDWKPIIPGPSIRGVFRSHCERILRTMSWHYAREHLLQAGSSADENSIGSEYKKRCAAKVDLWKPDEKLQDDVRERWEQMMRGKGSEEEKRHNAGKEIADLVWQESDISERIFGSTFWKSLVSISEAYIPDDKANEWRELLFDHLAVERFSGGAMEGKKFDSLPITKATFEGKIAVWGDEIWMLGLVALFFKDLSEGLIRFGSGKTRGYGKISGSLTKVEAFLLPGTKLANLLKIDCEAGKVWQQKCWELTDYYFPQCLEGEGFYDLKELLKEGVNELNELVKQFKRETDEKEGGEG